jgi:hypothetical protein
MKKLFMAVIALMMTISASAQFYIYFSDGTVVKVDSISTVAPKGSDTPDAPDTPDTTFVGVSAFSIAANKQVTFSKGNLQYHPANNIWRFAEKQTDCIGAANSNISATYDGWLDLFGWSTSATNFGVSTSTSNYSGSFVDWGTNKIGNDAPNSWRTLTREEWNYVLNTRNNASSLVGVAQVNGVNGLVLLPDGWLSPEGVIFKSGFHSSYGVSYYAAYQTFTAEQWAKLESAGAVFFPAAGDRSGSSVYSVQYDGGYWSSTSDGSGDAAPCLHFTSGAAWRGSCKRDIGQSVRLVKDL